MFGALNLRSCSHSLIGMNNAWRAVKFLMVTAYSLYCTAYSTETYTIILYFTLCGKKVKSNALENARATIKSARAMRHQ